MICLGTNYLIMALVANSHEARRLLHWSGQGETFCVSAIVWYEFLCGPITDEQENAIKLMLKEIVPFDSAVAQSAAILCNQIGRKRKLRVDTMIAATAISKNIPFATCNTEDFLHFEPFGLLRIDAAVLV
jgi:predicted nucleic acid-binding protein